MRTWGSFTPENRPGKSAAESSITFGILVHMYKNDWLNGRLKWQFSANFRFPYVMFWQLFVFFVCVVLLVCCTMIVFVAHDEASSDMLAILRLSTSTPVSLAMDWTPEDGSKKRDRPKRTSQDTLKENVQSVGITGTREQVESVVSDLIRWKQLVA